MPKFYKTETPWIRVVSGKTGRTIRFEQSDGKLGMAKVSDQDAVVIDDLIKKKLGGRISATTEAEYEAWKKKGVEQGTTRVWRQEFDPFSHPVPTVAPTRQPGVQQVEAGAANGGKGGSQPPPTVRRRGAATKPSK